MRDTLARRPQYDNCKKHVKRFKKEIKKATPAGLEPVTSAVTGRRSNQLSYGAIVLTCVRQQMYILLKFASHANFGVFRIISRFLLSPAREHVCHKHPQNDEGRDRNPGHALMDGNASRHPPQSDRQSQSACFQVSTSMWCSGLACQASHADLTMSSTSYLACQPISSLMRFGEPIRRGGP